MKLFIKVLPLLVTIALVVGLHQLGTIERGYHAIGGEALFCCIAPLWYTYVHVERRYKQLPNEEKEEPIQDEHGSEQFN